MAAPVALVTGGASGIGLAIVEHLISKGYRVAIGDVNVTDGEKIAERHPENIIFQRTDVSSFEEQRALFERAFSWGGSRLDFLAANAGIADSQSIFSTPSRDEHGHIQPLNTKTLEINLDAVVQGIWLFRHFAGKNEARGGKVLITSSAAGLYQIDSNPLYGASKYGLVGLTRSLAQPLAEEKITVNCICPGFIVTNLCPKHVVHKFPKEHITPMSTALKAVNEVLESDTMTGQVMELSLRNVYHREQHEYPNESQRWIGEESGAFWDEAYKV